MKGKYGRWLAWAGVGLLVAAIGTRHAVHARMADTASAAQDVAPMVMTTTAFDDGGVIPVKYTSAAHRAVSPPLNWTGVPPGTQSFVLLMHDVDSVEHSSSRFDYVHWLVWNIPGGSTGLPEGLPAEAQADGTQQVSFVSNGYAAPGAPPGPYHHYVFELYALDCRVNVWPDRPARVSVTRAALFDAMNGHVLGKAALVGRFHL